MIIKKTVTGIVALAIVSTMAVTTALATTSATKEVYGQSYAYYIHSVEVRTDKDNQIAIDRERAMKWYLTYCFTALCL